MVDDAKMPRAFIDALFMFAARLRQLMLCLDALMLPRSRHAAACRHQSLIDEALDSRHVMISCLMLMSPRFAAAAAGMPLCS